MAQSARELITRAFYTSQIVSRQLQTVSKDQITDGLFLLNEILQFKSTDLRLIPYFQRQEFYTIAGQEDYYIPNVLFVDAITFNIGDVRYSMTEKTRDEYFAIARVDNIQSLPFCYRCERELGGMRIYMYYVPQSNYLVKMSAKYGFTNVTLDTDMELSYDPFFLVYLRYELAQAICEYYGATYPDETRLKYMEIEKKLMDVSPPDLSLQNSNYFDYGSGLDWQYANLGKGYLPF